MKRMLALLSSMALSAVVAVGCNEGTPSPTASDVQPHFGVGNQMPSGGHYTLNILGMRNDKTAPMDGSTGGRIFVKLYYDDGNNTGDCWSGNCPVDMKLTDRYNKILLQPGSDFAVLDANATDKDGALFQLPTDVSYTYQVFARALGQPGHSATMTTCGTYTIDPDGIPNSGDEYQQVLCSLSQYVAMRDKGKPTTDNVTGDLLFINVDLTSLATSNPDLATCLTNEGYSGSDSVPLFDSCFQDYFWDYDNNGLKLLQLRFYPIAS